MFFGAFMAGATAEGGGAFAFPIFTLFLKISPNVARDFSWLIQSVGMTCASLTIIARKQKFFKSAILFPFCGSLLSTPVAFYFAKFLKPIDIKFFFVSLWIGFLYAYFLARKTPTSEREDLFHQNKTKLYLFGIGLFGGTISGMVGSGLDLLTFSFLVLYLKCDIKVATASSVVLMALNSFVSASASSALGLTAESTYLMWWAAVPVVCFMAPAGVWFVEKGNREWIFRLLAFSIIAQFCASLLILPWQAQHILLILFVTTGSIVFFIALSRALR